MTVTISRLFDDYATASKVVRDLEAAGIPHSDISIVSNNADNWYTGDRPGKGGTTGRDSTGRVDRDRDGVDDRAEGAGAGAGIGAAVGGAAGLLAGLGLLAIPGIGPVVAAGWLISTAAGAAIGATAAGIVGALTQAGDSEEDAHAYAEGVRRGGTLVTARVPDDGRARYEAMLDQSSVNIRDRSAAYRKAGWSKFDTKAPPSTGEQIRREHDLYRSRAA